eukprot:gene45549-61710_t
MPHEQQARHAWLRDCARMAFCKFDFVFYLQYTIAVNAKTRGADNTLFKEAYNRCLGDLSDRDNLPSEPELGERYGISRTTVRAILSRM